MEAVTMEKYRIVRRQYFNEKAILSEQKWRVEEWRRGLFGHAWRPLTHMIGYGGDSFSIVTEFDSLDDAKDCIARLKSGRPRQESVEDIVTV